MKLLAMRRTALCAAALLVLSVSAWAQQECPIEITKVHSKIDLHVIFRNITKKELRAYELSATFFDAVGNAHPSYHNFIATDKVKPGGRGVGQWNQSYNKANQGGGAQIVILKAKFADGSTWADDGSKSCRFKSDD